MVKIHVVPPPLADVPRIKNTAQDYELNKEFDASGIETDKLPSLHADLARLEAAITALSCISCHGNLTVTVAQGSFAFSGELTTYASALADQIEANLRRIDKMGIAIGRSHRGSFRATFTFNQTMEYLYQ